MSAPIFAANTGAMVAIIAAAAAKKRQEQEEKMVTYDKNDLDGWEFKIVRSAFGKFSNPDNIRKLCDEEAKAGWQMLEKFDDNRIRFKRRVEKRGMDQYSGVDAYKTSSSSGSGLLVGLVIGIIALFGGVFALLYGMGIRTDPPYALPMAAILVLVLVLGIVAIVAKKGK